MIHSFVSYEKRNSIFHVSRRVSDNVVDACRAMTCTRPEKERVALELGATLTLLLLLAEESNIDLPLSIQLKIQLNAKKYPADIVRCPAVRTVYPGILLFVPLQENRRTCCRLNTAFG